jgi:transposase-like protein
LAELLLDLADPLVGTPDVGVLLNADSPSMRSVTCASASLASARPQAQHGLLAALIRPIFQADSGDQARQRLGEAIAALEDRLPKVAAMLADSEEDILAFYSFSPAHWSKLSRSG